MADILIDRPDGRMPAYLALPAGAPPWPGVVVVHDALGMTSDLRRQADWLASAGFAALAPDLFHRGGRVRCLFATMRAAAAGSGPVFEDLDAARRLLTARPDSTGTVGVVGYCLGGGIALMLATWPGYGAAGVNYGGLPADAETALAHACPVVASYGGRDRTLRKAPHDLERILTGHGVPHDIAVYPDAGHGFLNDHPPREVPRWAVVAGAVARTGYHEPSAVDARRRIVGFLRTHLGA